MDKIIAAKSLQVERKGFQLEFRENDRGQFLRITEESHGRRNTIIVPSSGLDDFLNALEDLLQDVDASNEGNRPAAAPVAG